MIPIAATETDYITTPTLIGELLTYDYTVSFDTLINRIVKEFDKHPELPGVLIVQKGEYMGAISRRKLLEELSLPYGVELFYKRPVSTLAKEVNISYAQLPARMRVEDAVRYALDRPLDAKYEPLVVLHDDGRLRMLDMHVLLTAQSQLLVNANQVVNQLFNVNRALSGSLDLNIILDSVLVHMKRLIPYKCASVVFFRNDKFDFVALRGFAVELDVRDLEIVVNQNNLCEIVRHSKEPLYLSDVLKRQNWAHIPYLPVTRSWLCVPLIHGGDVLGMLMMMSTQPDAYVESQIELAQTFAELAALALKNAVLFKEVNTFTQQLEKVIEERTQNLQVAYQKLENLDQAKNEFMEAIIRELDQPIKQISGHGKYLLTQPFQENEQTIQTLVQMGEGIKHLRNVFERLQEVILIDSNDFEIDQRRVDISELLRRLGDSFSPLIRERRITCHFIQIDHLPPVLGDANQLYKVFYHLMENAIRYTPNKGRITIKGAYHVIVENGIKRGELQISMQDTGVGIERAAQSQIFEKFYKMKPSIVAGKKDSGGVAGLGLAIARKVVNAHRGKIWVESAGHDEIRLPGSTFFVVLPTMQTSESPSTLPTGVTL